MPMNETTPDHTLVVENLSKSLPTADQPLVVLNDLSIRTPFVDIVCMSIEIRAKPIKFVGKTKKPYFYRKYHC